MELLKLLSTSEIVAQIISFMLLLFLLRKFMWKPFLKVIDDRREKVSSDLLKIENAQTGIAKLKKEYEDKVSDIDKAARVRIEEAISEGKRISDELREDAEKRAERIITNANEMVKGELIKAKEELKETIVDLTMKVSEKIIEEKLSEAQDKKLVEDFLNKIDKAS